MNLFLAEWIGSFVLVFMGTGAVVVNDLTGGVVSHSGVALVFGMAVGMTVAMEALFAGPVTGASMNPARSLAPALVSGYRDSLWIYVSAPFAGAALASFLHRLMERERKKAA